MEVFPQEAWKKQLEGGLSFVVDTNYEYDLKMLLKKEYLPRRGNSKQFFAYKQYNDGNNFTVMFKTTISKTII